MSCFGILIFFCVTVRLFMLHSYCETYEMESSLRTLGDRSSATSSISLA